MDGNVLTVSLGAWMELPNLSLSEWRDVEADYGKRINASLVAEYYQDYIKKMDLNEYFSNDTVVTSVRKVKDCSLLCEALNDRLLGKCRSQFDFETDAKNDKIKIDTHKVDEKDEDLFIQELGGELEEDQRNGYRKKTSSSSSSNASTLSECSESNTLAMDQLSLPQSFSSSEKNMSQYSNSNSTSGFGDSVSDGSPVPPCGCPQPCPHVYRTSIPPRFNNRSISLMEGGEGYQNGRSTVSSRLLDHRSISMVEEERGQHNHNKTDALSSTRMGKIRFINDN